MTEGRVRELLGLWGENGQVTLRACLVAAEAREEGIEEMRDALLEEWKDNEIRCGIIILHAERLKEEKS